MTISDIGASIDLRNTKGGMTMAVVNGNLLKSKMAQFGFNNGTLAEAIGVDRDTIGNIINGKTKPSYPVMNAIYFELKLNPKEASEIFFSKNLRIK